MLNIKRVSLAGVATGALITAMSGTAFAQSSDYYSRDKYEAVTERRQPEFDPEPLRLGAFTVNSSAFAGIGYTSNALGTSSNEESDVIARIGADVAARTNWSVHEVGASVSVSRDEYQDFSDQSATDVSARLRGRLDVTRAVSLGAAAFYRQSTDQPSDPSNTSGLGEPIEYTNTGIELSANYASDRVRWTNSVTLAEVDYDDTVAIDGTPIDEDFRDRSDTRFNSRLSYALTPNLAVFGQGIIEQREYDNKVIVGGIERSRDSDAYTVYGGVNFELNTLVRGDIAVGFMSEEMDDDFYEDTDGLAVNAEVEWFPTRLTTVTFNGGRRTVDSGVATSASSVQTVVGARVDHELYRNIILSGYGELTNYEYEDSDRDDDISELGVIGTYKMNKRVHLNAFARHVERDRSGLSFAGTENYSADLLGISVRIHP